MAKLVYYLIDLMRIKVLQAYKLEISITLTLANPFEINKFADLSARCPLAQNDNQDHPVVPKGAT